MPKDPFGVAQQICGCTAAQRGGFHLIPWRAIECLAAVYEYGARKYAPNSWREVPRDPDTGEEPIDRYFNALMRHLIDFKKGEWMDKESELPHLYHALWNVIAVLELSLDRRLMLPASAVEKDNG
jgi:hypothetical protein